MTDDQRHAALRRSLRDALLANARGATSGATGDDPVSREAESRALAAFRTARDAGEHTSRTTRPRDDWSPSARRRRSPRSLKTALAALVASVTLGGVAIAAGNLPDSFLDAPAPPPTEPLPSSTAPDVPTAVPPESPSTSGPRGGVVPDRTDQKQHGMREGKKHGKAQDAKDRPGAGKGGPEKDGRGAPSPTAAEGAAGAQGADGAERSRSAADRSERPDPAHPLGKPRPARS